MNYNSLYSHINKISFSISGRLTASACAIAIMLLSFIVDFVFVFFFIILFVCLSTRIPSRHNFIAMQRYDCILLVSVDGISSN